MICKKCKGTSIKTHKNYPHGKKSKPNTTFTCRNCGSLDIDMRSNNRKGGRYKR